MGFGVSYLRPFAFEKLTLVAAVVKTLTEVTYMNRAAVPPDARQAAMEASITVEGEAIRFRVDGTDPDASTGHSVAVGSSITITGLTAIKNFKAYSTGAAILQVTYYNG